MLRHITSQPNTSGKNLRHLSLIDLVSTVTFAEVIIIHRGPAQTPQNLGKKTSDAGVLPIPIRLLVQARGLGFHFGWDHVWQVLDHYLFLKESGRLLSSQGAHDLLEHVLLGLLTGLVGSILGCRYYFGVKCKKNLNLKNRASYILGSTMQGRNRPPAKLKSATHRFQTAVIVITGLT